MIIIDFSCFYYKATKNRSHGEQFKVGYYNMFELLFTPKTMSLAVLTSGENIFHF